LTQRLGRTLEATGASCPQEASKQWLKLEGRQFGLVALGIGVKVAVKTKTIGAKLKHKLGITSRKKNPKAKIQEFTPTQIGSVWTNGTMKLTKTK
jgi:hypothetical protein